MRSSQVLRHFLVRLGHMPHPLGRWAIKRLYNKYSYYTMVISCVNFHILL
jgi:hypothetical protein